MYISFETNIRISNFKFVFKDPNIQILFEYLNIRLSPNSYVRMYTYVCIKITSTVNISSKTVIKF